MYTYFRTGQFDNTTGTDNVATGYRSLYRNTTGIQNTAIGSNTLLENTTGSNNTVIGATSLYYNTTGYQNSAFGSRSLYANTTGSHNVASGLNSLGGNTTGNKNTATGHESLISNSIGNNNTALGYQSGHNSLGDANVFIGYKAGYFETGSHKFYIDNTNADADNALIYGEFGTDNTTTGNILRANSQFQIGNPTLTGYAFPLVDGAANQILKTDGNGQISFVNPNTIFTATDNQTVDQFNLTGTTLNLSLEDDGAAVNTVDLSGLLDNTDDQTVDQFNLTGTTLNLSLEDDGAAVNTVDLSGLLDNTDDQIVDQFNLTGTTLNLSLENDGASVNTVDLSSLQDGNTQNTLDQAYDEGGAGAGRIITADTGAVSIAGTDGFQITGTHGSGATITLAGAGTRMFFNPNKAAFRVGSVTGAQWDDANVGLYSVAMGISTTASGNKATAMGKATTASGISSTAMGNYTIASSDYTTAMGFYSTASGIGATAIGSYTTASGDNTITMGVYTTAKSYAETSIGIYNTDYTPNLADDWDANDRLFVIGNGEDSANKSNALTIYKSGKMNINDEYDMPLTDGTANQVMATNGSGVVSFVNPNTIFTDTDNQIVDQFNLTGTTLNLSLEDDGVAVNTVDLSSLQDGNTQNTLDQAYDEGGAGAGRTITTDSGALLLSGADGLEINGDQAEIVIANTSENESGVHFKDAGNDTQYADVNFDNSNTNTSLNFYVNTATPMLTLDDNQNVGVGTTTPTEKLAVAGILNLNEGIATGRALKVNGTEALWFNGTQFSWGYGGSENYFADKVGIGNNAPAYKLDVKNNTSADYVAQIYNPSTNANADGLRIRIDTAIPGAANYFIGFYDGSNTQIGRITGSGGSGIVYNTTSDRRLKTNIVSIKNALDIIKEIQPRKYEFKANRGVEEFGFIAQELQQVYPQAVSGDPNGNVKTDPMMVDYSRLTPILTAGIKELNNEIATLKEKNKQQEIAITKLKKQMEMYKNLETRIKALENKN